MQKVILGFLLILITFSCREEKLGFVDQKKVADEKAALFVQLLPIANRFAIDPSKKTIFATPNKTYFEIPAKAFVDKSGNPVKKTISLDILEIKKSSDIIRCNSNSIPNDVLSQPIIQFKITAKTGNEELFLANDKSFKTLIESSTSLGLTNIFLGTEHPNGILWEEDMDMNNLILNAWDTEGGTVSGFEMTLTKMGWISLQTSLPNYEKASLSIELPNQYSSKNTAVYTVIKSMNAVIPMLDNPDQHGFYSSQIPKDKDISIISISKQGNNEYFFSKKDANLKEASGLKLDPKMVTFTELMHLLEE